MCCTLLFLMWNKNKKKRESRACRWDNMCAFKSGGEKKKIGCEIKYRAGENSWILSCLFKLESAFISLPRLFLCSLSLFSKATHRRWLFQSAHASPHLHSRPKRVKNNKGFKKKKKKNGFRSVSELLDLKWQPVFCESRVPADSQLMASDSCAKKKEKKKKKKKVLFLWALVIC